MKREKISVSDYTVIESTAQVLARHMQSEDEIATIIQEIQAEITR